MVGSSPHQVESAGFERQDDFLNLEWERNHKRYQEGSVHTTHISRSHSRVGSHVSQRQNGNKALQQEIDDLKKKLRHAQRRRSSFGSNTSFNEEGDDYRQRSRTPPSETFSHEEEYHHKRRHKSPSRKGLGNDAMNEALDWISMSPFTRRIEGAKLPR